MHNERAIGFISSKELTDLYDCVALIWRGNYNFDKILKRENMANLDKIEMSFDFSFEMDQHRNYVHSIAAKLKPYRESQERFILEMEDASNFEEQFKNSALRYFSEHLNLDQGISEQSAWATIGRHLAEVQFGLHAGKPGQKASASDQRDFVDHVVVTLAWWSKQLHVINRKRNICALYRNGNVKLPLAINFATDSEIKRINTVISKPSMTAIIRCLKDEQMSEKMRHPNIASLIDQTIRFKTTSIESLQAAFKRGKVTNKYNHLK